MFELLGIDYDARIDAYSILARMDYEEYLKCKGYGYEKLEIQRGVISSTKAYSTLREDMKRGCLMPPIVLATFETYDLSVPAKALNDKIEEKKFLEKIKKDLHDDLQKKFLILDGLQRTKALEDVKRELEATSKAQLKKFLKNILRVEIWTNISLGGLAYRMLLLNAGQRPMSIKHQLEVLNHRLELELKTKIPDMNVVKSLDWEKDNQPGTFKLSLLSQGLYSWIQGTPHIDFRATVLDVLLAEDAIENLSSKQKYSNPKIDQFLEFVQWMYTIDTSCTDKAVTAFFRKETVIQGIAAAISKAPASKVSKRLVEILKIYKKDTRKDPLGIGVFDELRAEIDPKLFNVGNGTRQWVYDVFTAYFTEPGATLPKLWKKKLQELIASKLK